jgi:transposase
MNPTTYGLDTAKRVFQVYWVDAQTGEIGRERLKRDRVLEFFAHRAPGRIALEACASSHWWARQFRALGHEVKLIHAKYVRPFVRTNKTDAADAEAIWAAAQHPGMRFVSVKNETQQAVLGVHRQREQLVKFRTMQVNGLRGLLYEFGVVLKKGREAGLAELRRRAAEIEGALPGLVWQAVQGQLERLARLEQDIGALERVIASWARIEARCGRVDAIAGVGGLTATALVATIGEDPKVFRSGRHFSAFVGLVPRQEGTGGKVRLGTISKRGDGYLRRLLIHGARSVVCQAKDRPQWVNQMLQRRPKNVVIVALANKMARTAWALLAHDRDYQRGYVSQVPA